MLFTMRIPGEFLANVASGQVVRYGCILKNVGNGQIVGHLKEVGNSISFLSRLPMNPLSGLSSMAQVGQWIDTHQQLAKIQQTLNTLQLIGTVGAVSSVAGLGVSVVGFAMVLRRLGRLEDSLNTGLKKLEAQVQEIDQHMNMLQMAELQAAWQQLEGAHRTDHPDRTRQQLHEADKTFLKHRNFYASLIDRIRPMENPKLSLTQVAELYGRFIACAVAELEANFYMEDYEQWFFRHEKITRQLKEMCGQDSKEVFRKRTEKVGLLITSEIEVLKEQMKGIMQFCRENEDRVVTSKEELQWVRQAGIRPREYQKSLEEAPDVGVVLIPHN
jgi:hypothetical protein